MRNVKTASNNSNKYKERINFGSIPPAMEMPNLIAIQKDSFQWFLEEGIRETFDDIAPIENTAKDLMVTFGDYEFGEPKNTVEECKEKDITYEAPMLAEIRFVNKETGEIKEQVVFMGDFPMMTPHGTFIINGTERVVVSQLVRSPGVYYDCEPDKTSDKILYNGKVIPSRGAWLEFETDKRDCLYVRIDRKRKQPATLLLKALDIAVTEDEIKEVLGDSEIVKNTLEKDGTVNRDEALVELYRRLRPGEPPTIDSARTLLDNMFFNEQRYDLAKVGRYKINKKLNLDIDEDVHSLTPEDIQAIMKYIVDLHNQEPDVYIDDIDHFGNRRIRTVGELIQNQFRIGLSRLQRVIRERMNSQNVDEITPQSLTNIRPLVAAIKEFFGSSQLSQFMDQNNPLSGITHKRRLSALGPGGLSRERAGMDVRDIHNSHYGRMCPIETPEGPNIGLIGSLATHARVNDFGFIETPYRRVIDGKVTDDVDYLTADEEEKHIIAQANERFDNETREFIEYDPEKEEWVKAERVLARGKNFNGQFGEPLLVSAEEVEYMDVSAQQMVSLATALIPFLEHDDANRALMGSNMQRQAVPLLRPSAPLVGTGLEHKCILDSGEIILAEGDGIVDFADAERIRIRYDDGEVKEYKLPKYQRSNQSTCINHHPIVRTGQRVEKNDILADGPSCKNGELALGQNLTVAYMPWEGYNYEDAIIISERVVAEDLLTSIHISKHEIDARDTKLGPEEITIEVPNTSDETLANLDADGIIRIGAEVHAGDVLVGKVTPKGETELTAEERLLRAIFGEKAREVRDTSLKMPHGSYGRVIGIVRFSREEGAELAPGVNELVRVYVAQRRKIAAGDKLSGRHGNKGVISTVLPVEDMPYLADGTPVDIILSPLGVPSRMNIGQLLETHLGWAAYAGWNEEGDDYVEGPFYVASPAFDGANEDQISKVIKLANKNLVARSKEKYGDKARIEFVPQLNESGKTVLYDGRTGEPFHEPITVGRKYFLKLGHMIDDKIHARATGPYSLITQQPLGGKAQFGGQRFGEMEVWALYAYGAANVLQEMLTVKSDDTSGRLKTYEAIVKGENLPRPEVPESFKVLVKEMRSLALDINFATEREDIPHVSEGIAKTVVGLPKKEEKHDDIIEDEEDLEALDMLADGLSELNLDQSADESEQVQDKE